MIQRIKEYIHSIPNVKMNLDGQGDKELFYK